MKKAILALLIGATALLGAAAAQAATMSVAYSTSGVLASPDLPGVPFGFLEGTTNLRYQATGGINSGSLGNVVSGPAAFYATLTGGIFVSMPPLAILSGAINTLVLSGSGYLSGGYLFQAFGGGIAATLHCSGLACASFGFIPSVSQAFSAPIFGSATGVATSGGALLPTITFANVNLGSFQGIAITGTLTMTEIQRHYQGKNPIPEPGGLALFAAGGLLVAMRLRRERFQR